MQDFWQPAAWQEKAASAFFNEDWSLNPHGKAYEDLVLRDWWTREEGKALIASGAVTKGMIPKLEESFAALSAGVRRIHIVGNLAPGELMREALSPGSVGTVLFP